MKEMKEEGLEQAIRDYIKKIYKKEYIGGMCVFIKGDYYIVKFHIPTKEIPTTLTYQTNSSEEFLKFVKEEIRIKNFIRTKYLEIKRNETQQRN